MSVLLLSLLSLLLTSSCPVLQKHLLFYFDVILHINVTLKLDVDREALKG